MKFVQLVHVLAFLCAFSAVPLAMAAGCPSELKMSDLLSKKYGLSLVALKTDTSKDKMDVDTFYFFNGKCECSFSAPPRVEFTWPETEAAVRSAKGLKALVSKIAGIKGQCPSVKNTWSPIFSCFRKQSPSCQGLT
jgi:hypothetical protein